MGNPQKPPLQQLKQYHHHLQPLPNLLPVPFLILKIDILRIYPVQQHNLSNGLNVKVLIQYRKESLKSIPTPNPQIIIQLQKKLINQNKPPQQLHHHYHPPLLPLLPTILISVELVHAKFTTSNKPAVLHVNLVAYLATEMHNKKQPLHLRPWLVTMLSSL